MTFDNTYARLPDSFYQRTAPEPVRNPTLIRLNEPLAEAMELELPNDSEQLARYFSGNDIIPGCDPIAQAYAGHQFGNFVPQLGDGRAHLLGEAVTREGRRYDIQLKGSGRTRFSRNGDGRAPLGPVIREYVVSEAMHALGVPTSRALAMVASGEPVQRENRLPGGVVTRVASSHIRVGTFEFFAARNDFDSVRLLADYAISRHYPDVLHADNPYAAFFEAVCARQAQLVARWMTIGFIHGVMNTDNTAISGETIDYGPCAFMDHYNPAQVFSSIDIQGRYAYNNQPTIAQWNMACLGGCLIPLLADDETEAHRIGEEILATFTTAFGDAYHSGMCRKIGLDDGSEESFGLVRRLLNLMHDNRADFTVTFRTLTESGNDIEMFQALFDDKDAIGRWCDDWRTSLARHSTQEEAESIMRAANPAFIPRNHRVEEAIRAAEDNGDFAPTHTLIEVLANPYADQPEHAEYRDPPLPNQRVHQTFCGT